MDLFTPFVANPRDQDASCTNIIPFSSRPIVRKYMFKPDYNAIYQQRNLPPSRGFRPPYPHLHLPLPQPPIITPRQPVRLPLLPVTSPQSPKVAQRSASRKTTCAWWFYKGHCKYPSEKCLFAHYVTGRVAMLPGTEASTTSPEEEQEGEQPQAEAELRRREKDLAARARALDRREAGLRRREDDLKEATRVFNDVRKETGQVLDTFVETASDRYKTVARSQEACRKVFTALPVMSPASASYEACQQAIDSLLIAQGANHTLVEEIKRAKRGFF